MRPGTSLTRPTRESAALGRRSRWARFGCGGCGGRTRAEGSTSSRETFGQCREMRGSFGVPVRKGVRWVDRSSCLRWKLRSSAFDQTSPGDGSNEVSGRPRRGGRFLVYFVLALGLVLFYARDGTILAYATENSDPNKVFSASGNPLVKMLCFLGVAKAFHKQRTYLKERSAALVRRGIKKIKSKKVEAVCIPLVAAFVGWLTNWLAVQMIFYPIDFMGLNLKRFVTGSIFGCEVLQPLGLLGWQGIVPAKAAKMGYSMVNMVTTKLIDVHEVFLRIDPDKIATLLSIQVPDLARDVGKSLFPNWAVSIAENAMVPKLTGDVKAALLGFQHEYLAGFVRCMQGNLERILSMDEFVTQYYVENKWLLNKFFLDCGDKELSFLVNSGVWFGFLLGLPQIVVWAFVDNIWSLVIGGLVVGYATNWLALKLIFEPVLPVKVGPLTIQGIFLSRQNEVSTAFADFYTTWVLKSKLIWNYLFTGPKAGEFKELLTEYNVGVISEVADKLSVRADLVDAGESYPSPSPPCLLAFLGTLADRSFLTSFVTFPSMVFRGRAGLGQRGCCGGAERAAKARGRPPRPHRQDPGY